MSLASTRAARLHVAMPQQDIGAFLRLLNATDDVQSTFLAALSSAAQLLNAARAALLVADDDGNEFALAARCNELGVTAINGEHITLDPAISQLLAHGDDTIVQVAADMVRRCVELAIGECSASTTVVAVVPLRRNGRLVGAVIAEAEPSSTMDPGQNELLWIFFEQVAVAIERVRALRDLRRRVDDLAAVVKLEERSPGAPSFEAALSQIIERIKELVDANAGGLMLYDPISDELVLQKPAVGYSDEVIRLSRMPIKDSRPGASVTVFLTGKPYMSNDLDSDLVIRWYIAKPPEARNMITVPVEVDGHRIGVFHIMNKRRGDFTCDDLHLISLLASHLGVLIQNAQLLQNERETVTKLQELNRVIDQQRAGLQRTLAIHDELTSIVLDGQGIPAIIATIGRLVANPVSVTDRFGSLISHYTPKDCGDEALRRMIVERGIPQEVRDNPAVRATLARLERERRPLRLALIPSLGLDQPRVVAPVVVGQEILGSLWILEGNRQLDELDMMATERAAIAVALQMMKEKAAAEAQYKLRGEFVGELLGGRCPSDEVLFRRAGYLGIDVRIPRAVLVIDIDGFTGVGAGRCVGEAVANRRAQVLDVVERACRRVAPASVVVAKSDEIILLVPTTATDGSDRRTQLGKLAESLRGEAQRWLPEISLSVGIGSVCNVVAEYPDSYEQARRAIDVIKGSRQRGRVLAFDQLGISGVLFDPQYRDKLISLARHALSGLLEYDRRHRTQLVETLDQYLLHDGHLERTAAVLHIHFSTLRYRLLRIQQIAGIRLDDGEAKLNLQLCIKILRTLNGA